MMNGWINFWAQLPLGLLLALLVAGTILTIGASGSAGFFAWRRKKIHWPSFVGVLLGLLLSSNAAWAADTKISALSATTDFLGTKEVASTNVTNTSNEKWQIKQIAGLTRRTITGADTVVASDRGKIIEATSGTFTLSFTAVATLADGHWFVVKNSGTGVVTLDPNASETIDGQTTITLISGGGRIVMNDGSAFFTANISYGVVSNDVFTANGTWNKHPWAQVCEIDVIAGGGGGGGGRGNATSNVRQGGSGGGGGARNFKTLPASLLGSSETITVGAAGTAGTGGSSADGTAGGVGGNSSFGAHVLAFGGGGGALGAGTTDRAGGSGGGQASAGTTGTTASIAGGEPFVGAAGSTDNSGYGGAGSAADVAGAMAAWGGGAGGGQDSSGGNGDAGGVSIKGGGGGGGGGGLTTTNTSTNGAAGGDNDQGGPSGGGGGGGTSGATCTAGTAGSNGNESYSGQGGGGGGGDSDSTGCVGGAGGVPGGAGGGGGGGTTTGGNGGAGGRGEIRARCYGALEPPEPANGNKLVEVA